MRAKGINLGSGINSISPSPAPIPFLTLSTSYINPLYCEGPDQQKIPTAGPDIDVVRAWLQLPVLRGHVLDTEVTAGQAEADSRALASVDKGLVEALQLADRRRRHQGVLGRRNT
jgi:hypothetical protein